MNRLRDMQRLPVDGADIIPYDPLRSFNPGSIGASIIRGLHPTNEDRTEDFNNISAGGSFVLTPGSYLLGSNPNDNDSGIIGFGAKFLGSVSPRAVLDSGITNRAALWSAIASSDGYAKYAHASQLVGMPSGDHDRDFLSAANIGSVVIYDNSTYYSDGDEYVAGQERSARDFVCHDGGTFVPGGLGLTRVRSWGFDHITSLGRGPEDNGTVDGNITQIELRIDNWGADSGPFQTSTSKMIYNAVAGGNKYLTCGYYVGASGQGGFYNGFVVDSVSVRDYAYGVIKYYGDGVTPQQMLWGVTPEGAVEFKGGITPPEPSAGRIRVYYDALDRLFALFPDGASRLIVGNPDNIHTLTSGGAYNASPNDEGVIVDKTVGSATFIAMPEAPSDGQKFFVKDGKGDAAANPITIVVLENEYPINSGSSYVIDKNDGSARFIFKSAKWYSI